MVVGESRVTNSVLRMIGPDTRGIIDNYINDVCSRDFQVMHSILQVKSLFSESLDEFLACLTEEDLLDLRSYTGYNFRNINAVSRGTWNYGNGNDAQKVEFARLANKISTIVNKFNMPKIDFVSFRGTTINSFSSYGISELSQLESLEGKFMYEQGFTSTSMLEDTCYFKKNLETGENYNIEIRYLIPSEANDGALLTDYNTTYSINQNEFVLNKGALSKVIDVKVDEVTNTAILTVVLVPKKVYEIDRTREDARNK